MGDSSLMDLHLKNKVYNELKVHSRAENKRSQRIHEKKEHYTAVRKQLSIWSRSQGLTLRFQTRGPKRSLDENVVKNRILVITHTILGP